VERERPPARAARGRRERERRAEHGPQHAAELLEQLEVVRRAALRPGGRASDIRCTSIRPSWVQDEGSYERNLGPIVRDPSVLIGNYCAYIDVHDLCDAVVLAIETDLPGHEVFYIASPDTIGGHPLVETVRTHYGAGDVEFRPTAREDASSVSTEKAERLLGWKPTRSWRDYLDEQGRSRA
jgi:nucleoside-diphosphate-sugar epimerase